MDEKNKKTNENDEERSDRKTETSHEKNYIKTIFNIFSLFSCHELYYETSEGYLPFLLTSKKKKKKMFNADMLINGVYKIIINLSTNAEQVFRTQTSNEC